MNGASKAKRNGRRTGTEQSEANASGSDVIEQLKAAAKLGHRLMWIPRVSCDIQKGYTEEKKGWVVPSP